MPMRILSRFSEKLDRGAVGGALVLGIALSSQIAAAQPAQQPPPKAQQQPPPPAPPAPPPAAPPAKAADEPLMPPAQAPAPPPPAPAEPPAKAPPAPDPDRDGRQLVKQGGERPAGTGDVGAKPSDVFAEDWWSQARPVFEIHGYFRTRAELFHSFALGRRDIKPNYWPQPADNNWMDSTGRNEHQVYFCGADPTVKKFDLCSNNTQAGANMRFRLNPEIHISDNLRVMAQIDMLDNVILGSTPESWGNVPSKDGGYQTIARGGYAAIGAFATTQWVPIAGFNSTTNSISVKRVWGEYTTPIGLLRFGRMPSHWGLGMLANAGDGYDSDWQSTADRIMLVTGIKKYDLYFAAAWDFPNEGATSQSFNQLQGQPYDLAQYDDVNQYVLVAVRRRNPELQKLDLAKGNVVVNGGIYFVYRNQFLANDGSTQANSANIGQNQFNIAQGYVRRGAEAYIPDLWLQFLYRKFRFEAEAAMIYGSLENTLNGAASFNYKNSQDKNNQGWKIRQFGLATQSEFRAMEDKLRIQFGFGWASGDPDVEALTPGSDTGLQPQLTSNRTFSTFRFHPDYRVDLILFRNILTRVQGAYYFRPSVDYDFLRDKNGQRLGGGAAIIWSRASEFMQTPGHARDLGIELNATIYYQSKDGSLNDDPDKMGGFYTMLQYGVLFPLGGFSYLPGQVTDYTNAVGDTYGKLETSTAQMLRWYLGILF